MTSSRIATVGFMLVLTFIAFSALAQDPVMLNKIGDASQVFAISDSVVSKGVVKEVTIWQHSPVPSAPSHGVILTMKNSEGEYQVYMGPQQLLESRGFNFHEGDKLDIEGVLANIDGNVMYVARSYTSAGSTFVLRNSEGVLVSR